VINVIEPNATVEIGTTPIKGLSIFEGDRDEQFPVWSGECSSWGTVQTILTSYKPRNHSSVVKVYVELHDGSVAEISPMAYNL